MSMLILVQLQLFWEEFNCQDDKMSGKITI